MKTALTAFLVLALLSQCRTAERLPSGPEPLHRPLQQEPYMRADSAKRAGQKTGLLARLTGRGKQVAAPVPTTPVGLRKCKGCTFVAAGASVSTVGKKATAATGAGATATTIAKTKAPVATGQATATDNTKAGQRGGAAATAPGAVATATTQKPGFPWGWFLGAGVACAWGIGAALTNSWGWPLRLFS